MRQYTKFYLGGEWCDAAAADQIEVINPATASLFRLKR